MVRGAGELHHVVAEPGDARHDRHGKVRLLEHGPLLDVELDKAVDVVAGGFGDAFGSEPDAAHDFCDRLAVMAHRRLQVGRRDGAGDRPRAPEPRGRKAAAFLLAKRQRFERAARRAELLLKRVDGDQRRDCAERAVIAPARPLRVDMRAGDDRLAAFGAVEPAPDVADRVAPDQKPRFGAPGGVKLGRGDPFRRVDGAPHAGAAVRPVGGELENPALDEAGVDGDIVAHGVTLLTALSAPSCLLSVSMITSVDCSGPN